MEKIFRRAAEAGRRLSLITPEKRDALLLALADRLENRAEDLLEANAVDLAAMGEDSPMYDRLKLTRERIAGIAADMRAVAALPSPLGRELERRERPNGMLIRKVTVPFGVIGVIYESRPNVTFDVFSLCFKAGSAVVLKGGHEAAETNALAVAIIIDALAEAGLPDDAVTLLPNDHDAVTAMLHAVGYIDVIIPRGSRRLIDFVRDNATVPVIETGAGVCHTYFHTSGDIATGRDIIFNAKTRRVSVCNALDCLIVDRSCLGALPTLCDRLAEKDVEIYADDESYAALEGVYPLLRHAADSDFGREWLDYKMSLKTVADIDEALDFITRHGSHHSECIVAEQPDARDRFLASVDAACVYANVSTAFTDGAQFGMGAEIGISTQKLHARGPMALNEIVTYKYLITGSGQTRV